MEEDIGGINDVFSLLGKGMGNMLGGLMENLPPELLQQQQAAAAGGSANVSKEDIEEATKEAYMKMFQNLAGSEDVDSDDESEEEEEEEEDESEESNDDDDGGEYIINAARKRVKSRLNRRGGSETLVLRSVLQKAGVCGCYPIQRWKEILGEVGKADYMDCYDIALGWRSYVTDAILYTWLQILENTNSQQEQVVGLSGTRKIDLTGCVHITDFGVSLLARLARHLTLLTEIILDGCLLVTERGISAFLGTSPYKQYLTLSVRGTSVGVVPRNLRGYHLLLHTDGCPNISSKLLAENQETEEVHYGSVLVCPPEGTKTSFVHYFKDKKMTPITLAEYTGGDLSYMEVTPDSPIFNMMLPSNPTQVIIPYDLDTDTKVIRTHAACIMTHFLAQEVKSEPMNLFSVVKSSLTSSEFSPLGSLGAEYDHTTGILEIQIDESEVPHLIMSTHFSRSNHSFELELLPSKRESVTEAKVSVGITNFGFDMNDNTNDGDFQHTVTMKVGDHLRLCLDNPDILPFEEIPLGTEVTFHVYLNENQEFTTTQPWIHYMMPFISTLPRGARLQVLTTTPCAVPLFQAHYLCGPCLWDERFACLGIGGSSEDDNVLSIRSTMGVSLTFNEIQVEVLKTGSIAVGLMHEVYDVETMPGDSVGSIVFRCDDGKIHVDGKVKKCNKAGYIAACVVGDIITVRVEDLADSPEGIPEIDEPVIVVFEKNGSIVHRIAWTFRASDEADSDEEDSLPRRLLFAVGMEDSSSDSISPLVRIIQKKPSKSSQLTEQNDVNKKHFLKLSDCSCKMEGELIMQKESSSSDQGVSVYRSSSQLTKDHPLFEVELTKLGGRKVVGIGLVHRRYLLTRMPGWDRGSIGWHMDNGKIYNESSQGYEGKSVSASEGDVIGCGIETEHLDTDEEGYIRPNQTVTIFFTLNGSKVLSEKFHYRCGGLHPSVGLCDGVSQVRLLNHLEGSTAVVAAKEIYMMSGLGESLGDGGVQMVEAITTQLSLQGIGCVATPHHETQDQALKEVQGMTHIPVVVCCWRDNTAPDAEWFLGVDHIQREFNKQVVLLFLNGTSDHSSAPPVEVPDVLRNVPRMEIRGSPVPSPKEMKELTKLIMEAEKKYKQHNTENCGGVKFLLVGMTDSLDSSADLNSSPVEGVTGEWMTAWIEEYSSALKDAMRETSSEDLYNRGGMDFQHHLEYGRQAQALEGVTELSQNMKLRVKALTVNTTTHSGYDKVEESIQSNQEAAEQWMPYMYTFYPSIIKAFESIRKAKDKKIVTLEEVAELCGNGLGKFNHVYDKILRIMHSWGQVLYFGDLHPPLAVVDIDWFLDILRRLHTTPPNSVEREVTSVHKDTPAWKDRELTKMMNIDKLEKPMVERLMALLLECDQFLRLHGVRRNYTDPKYYVIHPQYLHQAPVSLDTYLSDEGSTTLTQSIMMEFLTLPLSAWYVMLASCTRFCQPVAISDTALIFHQGAAEIVITYKAKGIVKEIEIKGRIYSGTEDKSVYCLTYLYSIMNIYCDIISHVTQKQALIGWRKVDETIAFKFANKSVSSNHAWEVGQASSPIEGASVCVLCGNCSQGGISCPNNGVVGEEHGKCPCRPTRGCCKDCGLCFKCVDSLWSIRSELRPACDVEKNRCHSECYMDHILNEATFTITKSTAKSITEEPICLISKDTSFLIHAFPGRAVMSQEAGNYEHRLRTSALKPLMPVSVGDTIKLRLREPQMTEGPEIEKAEGPARHQRFFYHLLRECKLWQSSGVVRYDGNFTDPVSLMASEIPLTPGGYFELEILDYGDIGAIAIGLVPKYYPYDQQPGWRRDSIGYHADDGGIFVEEGHHSMSYAPCQVGDKMGCGMKKPDSSSTSKTHCIYFTKNGEQVTEVEFGSVDKEYFAAVGMHSSSETIQLLPSPAWAPPLSKLAQLDIMNKVEDKLLTISPGRRVEFPRRQDQKSTFVCKTFIEVNRKSKKPVLVKVKVTNTKRYRASPNRFLLHGSKDSVSVALTLSPGEASEGSVVEEDLSQDQFLVQWAALPTPPESTSPTDAQIKAMWDKVDNKNIKSHKIGSGWGDSQDVMVEKLEYLPKTSDGTPAQPSYELEVSHNGTVVNKVWIPRDKYIINVASKKHVENAGLIFTQSKFPSAVTGFSRDILQGQQMLVGITPDHKQAIQYFAAMNVLTQALDQMKKDNTTLYVLATLHLKDGKKMFHITFPGDVIKLTPEECTQHLFHDIVFKHNMVPEDGSKGLSLPRNSSKYTCTLENGWYTYEFRAENDKKDILCFPKDFFEGNYNPHVESFSSESNRPLLKGAEGLPWMGPCLHSTNSFAVLEHSLRMMHDSMIGRLASKDHHPDFVVTFLPMSLSLETLLYPSLADLHNMQRLAVHKLCRRTDVKQLVNGEMVSNLVHFVDKAGVEVVDAPHPSYMYEDVQSLSKYCLLASKNMRLPVYKKLLQLGENADDLIKEKIEQRLHAIVKIYASTCYLMVHANRSRPLQTLTGAADWMERWITATGDSPLMDIDRRGVCDAHAYTEFLVNSDNVVEKMAPLCEILTMATFNLEGKEETIPDNLHIHMPGLQVLEVTDADALSSLPRNLSQMFHLKKLSVRKKSQLCQLPGDIGDCQSLIDLVCYRSCLTQLPTSLERCRTLQRLSVHNSLLSGLPEGMGRLQSLTYLDISSNPITKLPPSFHELTSLKTLKLSGVPWRILSGPGAFARLSDHASWIAENEENTKILGKEKMLEMLKEKEISSDLQRHKNDLIEVNTEIYFEVPRLGHDYEEWDTDGGIPIEIFDLVNLEVLELKHQAIRSVPPEIINLTKLHTLNLNHCPQLESLPGAMGDLPALQTLNLRSCPSLRTPPNEVVGRGTAAVLGYLKRLEAGFTRNWRTKLMLVGLGGAGKTSLLRALMSSDKTTTGTTADEVTDGIDIKTWSVSHKGGATVTYSAWDFAGQSVYYNTHQFFLSSRAVYLLLWTTRQGYEHAGLEFWLSSIQCHAPKAPIFIVATHADQVSKTRADLPMKDLRKRYPQIQGFHFVSSIQGTGIQELETAIVEATLKESYMGEKVPTVYLNLEKSILKVRQDSSTMKWKDVKKCGMEVGIYNEKDISRAVQFLHDLGTVQYFDNEFLREYIVIDPQWIVDVMACVVSIKDSPIKAGSLHHCDIDKVWSKFPRELYDWLLRLTEAFDLTFPIPNQKVNMVPCLLPPHEPEVDLFPSIEGKPGWRQTMMLYKFAYLPAGLFNRMQVRLFQFSDSDIIWKRGSRLRKNEHLALVKQLNDRELVVTVQGPRPENILFLVHEVIESLIMENFRGVHYDYLIPCPDCVQRVGLDNPKMHKGSKIREAANWNAPFLQCTRYFHIVSMAILQALVPPDSSNEFEVHLEQSVHNLSSLLANLSTDILISYCGADVPTTPEQAKKQVHPARVSEALVKQGYSVWYHDNMDKLDVHDVTMAVQDSKIVVFFMSDQFEKDEACRRLFLHTVESLRKPFVLVVVGTGMDWQKTNVGYVIGPQEVFIRMKVVDDFYENTFPLKMIELQEAIGSKLKSLFPEEKEHVCFLSYAWSNSAQCVQRGTKKIPGALGKVDPRQIGQELENRGISCWIDYEHVGKNNLFEDIRLGLDQCSMAVLCVSEQYAKSKNCMMELRYAMVQLEKPAVIVLVGTGDGWMDSEIPIHVQRSKSTRLDMQHSDDPQLFDRLEELVKERIPKDREAKKAQRKMDQGPQMDLTNISYHEELELAQRKFQRHLAMLADKMDSLPYPRLVVLDFLPEEVEDKNKDEKTGRPKSGRSQPRVSRDGKTQISKRKSRINDAVTTVLDDEDDDTNLRMEREQSAIMEEETRSGADSKHGWSECDFCFRILCEADKGWHLSEHIVPLDDLSGVEIVNFVSLVAPYIGRMYAILTHSKIQLRCLNDDPTSLEFSTFVYNMAKNAPVDFTQAYCNMLEAVTKYSRKSTITLLKRCHLPTGKISWLCEGHQKDSRVTILSSDVATGGSHSAMVTEEDELMRDNLAKYEHLRDKYRTRKNEKPQQKAEEDKEEDKEVVPQRPKSGRPKVTPDEKTMRAAAAVLTGVATPPIKTLRHSRPSSAASSTSTATGRGQRTPSARARSERARQKFRAGADAAKVVSGWPGQPTSKACLIL